MSKRVARALLCAAIALAAPALWATTVLKQTDSDMIRKSGIILTGHCTNLEPTWVGRTLVTKATIAVDEVLQGSAVREVTVVLPGGVDVHRRIPVAVTYPGAPEILVREQVLLFLTPDNMVRDGFSIVGYSQGKFTLVKTTESGLVGTRNLSDLRLQNGSTVVRGGATSISLEQLRARIRDLEAGKLQ
ncbi:MAG: hypothetical protein ABUT39_09775 [Acidobacteriota bacterium]